MEIVAEMEAECAPAQLFAWVDDLSRYPEWLEIVTRAEPEAPSPAGTAGEPAGSPAPGSGPVADTDGAAWAVDLRGRVGPLARSKRLRMVRTLHAPPHRVRFERVELDGRNHSPWTLEASVDGSGTTSRLSMSLRYGGGLFGPVLERILRDEIARSRAQLASLVASGAGKP